MLRFWILLILVWPAQLLFAQGVLPFAYWGAAGSLTFTTAAQSNYSGVCSSAVTIQNRNRANRAANVTSDLVINLTTTGTLTFYSNASCTTPITSVTIPSGSSQVTFYHMNTAEATETIAAKASDRLEIQQTATTGTNPFIWTGGGANANWATNANWSGGVPPNSSQIAVFNGSCVSNCSPTIAANINVKGIRLESGYNGTVTQANGVNITIGSVGWVQNGGTFVGSTTGNTITQSGPFTLASGTYTSTTGTLTTYGAISLVGSSTFNHAGGTLKISSYCCSDTAIDTSDKVLNNVIIQGTNSVFKMGGSTMKVDGSLTLTDNHGVGESWIYNGTIEVKGDYTKIQFGGGSAVVALVGSGTQTVTSSGVTDYPPSLRIASTGTVKFVGDFKWVSTPYSFEYLSGTIDAGTSSLHFAGGCGTNTFIFNGPSSFNNIRFGGHTCSGNTWDMTGTLKVAGTLTLDNAGGTGGTFNGGTIEASGDVVVGSFSSSGTGPATVTLLKLVGSATRTFSGTANGYLPSVEIAAPGGTINLAGTITLARNSALTYTSGTINAGTSTMQFGGGCGRNQIDVSAGTPHFYNVAFKAVSCSGQDATITGTLHVDNDLIFDYAGGDVDGGAINVKGNVTVNSGSSGTTAINLVGTSAQTWNQPTAYSGPYGTITLNNTAGLTLLTNVAWSNGTQNVDVTTGNISMNGKNLTTKALTLNGNTITKGGGVLTVNGVVAGTGALFGGTVNP